MAVACTRIACLLEIECAVGAKLEAGKYPWKAKHFVQKESNLIRSVG